VPTTMKAHAGRALAATLLVYGSMAGSATSNAANAPEATLRCVNLSQVRELKIIDNKHIAFELNNHEVYVNTLPHACPGLAPNKAILYKPTMNQLCNVDVITLLESFGRGFTQAGSCGLGNFELMSKEEGATVIGKKPRGPRY
jgi:hypothetical protein